MEAKGKSMKASPIAIRIPKIRRLHPPWRIIASAGLPTLFPASEAVYLFAAIFSGGPAATAAAFMRISLVGNGLLAMTAPAWSARLSFSGGLSLRSICSPALFYVGAGLSLPHDKLRRHCLFNNLNAIVRLIRTRPTRAELSCLRPGIGVRRQTILHHPKDQIRRSRMQVLIADNEKPACARLSDMLEKIPGFHIAGFANDGYEAVFKVSKLNIDIILMDIRMPHMNGLEAARHLKRRQSPPAVIFTTSYCNHAMSALEHHASGYLLKPVRPEQLAETLEYVRVTRAAKASARQVAEPDNGYICCRTGHCVSLIAVDKIYFLQASNKYTTVVHEEGEALSSISLRRFELEYAGALLRTHRNTLINKAYLKKVEREMNGGVYVSLKNLDRKFKVSRRNVADLRRHMNSYLRVGPRH